MYPFSRRPVHAAVFIALTGQAVAESSLPPIFITAGRVAEPVEETLFSTSTVTREDIEKQQPRDLGEILGQQPGIEVGRNGGAGQVTSAFIRGAESDQTLLLVDGVPVNSGTIGSPALQHFMPDQIERVEVVRGPASTLYGSGAIGGVVQIFTKRRTSGQSASITAGGGSENSKNVAGRFDYGNQDTFANLSFSYRDTDGYEIQPEVLEVDRGYENTSFSGAIGSRFGDLGVELSYLRSEGFVEYLTSAAVDQDTLNSVARLALDYSPASNWHSRLLFARARDEIEQNQPNSFTNQFDFAYTERDYIDWQNTVELLERHTLVGGVTANWTDTESRSFFTFYDQKVRSIEYYLQDTIELGDTRLQIGGRAIDNEQYGNNYTWNLAAGHRLNDSVRLHANAGTAFRAPSSAELFGFQGNPDLDPETSLAGEIGVVYDVSPTQQWSATAFQNDIDDLIASRSGSLVNIEEARIRGIELGYRLNAAPWTLTADYTYQDPQNRKDDERLLRRARNIVHARLNYSMSNWWTQASLRYQDERPDIDPFAFPIESTTLDAYTTVDVSAGYRFDRSLSITGRIQNLFDEDYELADSYPAQGRFVGVELRYDYDAD